MTRFVSDDYGPGYWENAEGSNYRHYGDDEGWPVILGVMAKHIAPNATVLEAACSKGYFLQHALRQGYDAHGFDLSEYAVSKAADPATATRMFVHDAIDPLTQFDPETFDVVCGWEFLEHISEEYTGAVIDNLFAVLKPGGEFWFKNGIAVPDDHPFAGQPDHDHTHVNMKTRSWWEDLFASYGMEHRPEVEADLDAAFAGRDWTGRFFVWRKV